MAVYYSTPQTALSQVQMKNSSCVAVKQRYVASPAHCSALPNRLVGYVDNSNVMSYANQPCVRYDNYMPNSATSMSDRYHAQYTVNATQGYAADINWNQAAVERRPAQRAIFSPSTCQSSWIPSTTTSAPFVSEKKETRKRKFSEDSCLATGRPPVSASGECAACQLCNEIISTRSMHKLISHLSQHDIRCKRYACQCGHAASNPTGIHRHMATRHRETGGYIFDLRGDQIYGYWRETMSLCFPSKEIMEKLEIFFEECCKLDSTTYVRPQKKS